MTLTQVGVNLWINVNFISVVQMNNPSSGLAQVRVDGQVFTVPMDQLGKIRAEFAGEPPSIPPPKPPPGVDG